MSTTLELLPEYHDFELLLARLRFWTGEDGQILADALTWYVRGYATGELDRASFDHLVGQARPVVDEWLDTRPPVGRGRMKRLTDELFTHLAGELAQAMERLAHPA